MAALAAVAAQCYALYAPSPPGTAPVAHADKIVHAGGFAIVTILLLAGRAHAWLLWPLTVGHAALSEVLQHLVAPARTASILDAAANLAGVGLGLVAWRVARRAAGRRTQGSPGARPPGEEPAGWEPEG